MTGDMRAQGPFLIDEIVEKAGLHHMADADKALFFLPQ
jgi:hypothetical protein